MSVGFRMMSCIGSFLRVVVKRYRSSRSAADVASTDQHDGEDDEDDESESFHLVSPCLFDRRNPLSADQLNQQQKEDHEEYQNCRHWMFPVRLSYDSVSAFLATLDLADDGDNSGADEEGNEDRSDNVFHASDLSLFLACSVEFQSFRQMLRRT